MSLLAEQPIHRSDFADDADFQEILGLFVDLAKEKANAIRTHFAVQDWTAMRSHAHQLKGSAGGYGFPELSDLALTLELQAKSGELSEEHVDRIVRYLDGVRL